jgi:hypothetical protein
MDRRYLLAGLLVLLQVILSGESARAGVFWSKKVKPTPAEYVPELIKSLKTDGDEHKRCSAAEELRQYDPLQFPDMVPALIEATLTDKKPSVRSEAAQTLGKLRPVSAAAGAALEQALAKDSSMRVRLQARSSLLQYRWAGYTAKGKDEPPTQSKEPPLATDLPAPVPAYPPKLTPVPSPAGTLPPAPRALPVATPVKRSQPPPESANAPDGSTPLTTTPFSLGKTTKTDDEKGPDLTPP